MNDPKTLFFSVGEPSGDLHGANLIRSLRSQQPNLKCVGYGGPKMQAAGMELHVDLTQWAVMWLTQVIRNLGHFRRLIRQADQYFASERPDAVILIDYPGFNWWIARQAKRHGIPVFYYGAPQLWAWAAWRIRKVRRLVDHLLCKLPFETQWYQARGCHARFIGHPYFDELTKQGLDSLTQEKLQRADKSLIGLLPGSRTQEVLKNLPTFLNAARKIHREQPDTHFVVASFNERQKELAEQLLRDAQLTPDSFPIQVLVGKTAEVIHASRLCLACSGSVSLELLYHRTPAVIHYRVGRLMYWFARKFLIKVRYMTLVNLLAREDRYVTHPPYDAMHERGDEVPYPELPTCRDRSDSLSQLALRWLRDPALYDQKVAQLDALAKQICVAGASMRAAELIRQQLDSTPKLAGNPGPDASRAA